jgi:hypothetical protein
MMNLFEGAKPASHGPARRVKRAAPQFTVQVINGNQKSEEKFASAGGQQ